MSHFDTYDTIICFASNFKKKKSRCPLYSKKLVSFGKMPFEEMFWHQCVSPSNCKMIEQKDQWKIKISSLQQQKNKLYLLNFYLNGRFLHQCVLLSPNKIEILRCCHCCTKIQVVFAKLSPWWNVSATTCIFIKVQNEKYRCPYNSSQKSSIC